MRDLTNAYFHRSGNPLQNDLGQDLNNKLQVDPLKDQSKQRHPTADTLISGALVSARLRIQSAVHVHQVLPGREQGLKCISFSTAQQMR